MVKALIAAAAAAAFLTVAAPAALADSTPSLAQTVVGCVYDASHCKTGSIGLAPGESVSLTKQQLADACKSGGYTFVGTANQGQCVSFVEHTLGSGVTVIGAGTTGGGDPGVRSDGNGGLIANIVSGGGTIAHLTSDGNGGLIAN